MRIDARTPIWVTDPTPVSTLPDICFETTNDGRLQFAGGLSMDQRPTLFTSQEEAQEEAKNRLLVWKVARQIRIDRRLPEGGGVRVTLHDRDGRVLFEGEVREADCAWKLIESTHLRDRTVTRGGGNLVVAAG